MTRRARLLVGAVAAALGALLLLPTPRPEALPGSAAASTLGPLRPMVATVLRLRFEARRRDSTVAGQLDDAWRALALVPENAADFATFAAWFLFDAPALARSAAEREACVRAGFELLAAGRRLHPRFARLDFLEAIALQSFARQAPERLAWAPLPSGTGATAHAFALLVRAHRQAAASPAPRSQQERELIAAALASAVAELLRDDATPAALRAEAAACADRLAEEEALSAEWRALLHDARSAERE
ncbi:MAG: hypothetical protein JNL90_17615 [Planctomycetes bacterium]|nr:hypothetical protein [Planctomycetota bacterium]